MDRRLRLSLSSLVSMASKLKKEPLRSLSLLGEGGLALPAGLEGLGDAIVLNPEVTGASSLSVNTMVKLYSM